MQHISFGKRLACFALCCNLGWSTTAGAVTSRMRLTKWVASFLAAACMRTAQSMPVRSSGADGRAVLPLLRLTDSEIVSANFDKFMRKYESFRLFWDQDEANLRLNRSGNVVALNTFTSGEGRITAPREDDRNLVFEAEWAVKGDKVRIRANAAQIDTSDLNSTVFQFNRLEGRLLITSPVQVIGYPIQLAEGSTLEIFGDHPKIMTLRFTNADRSPEVSPTLKGDLQLKLSPEQCFSKVLGIVLLVLGVPSLLISGSLTCVYEGRGKCVYIPLVAAMGVSLSLVIAGSVVLADTCPEI